MLLGMAAFMEHEGHNLRKGVAETLRAQHAVA